MARVGNHGQIIPRDRSLMMRLYWDEEMSLAEIGERYGVTHKSVARVFDDLGIKRRPRRTKGQSKKRCRDCGKPVLKILHAKNGALYGRLCAECRREYRNAMAREYVKRPYVRQKRKTETARWYLAGAITPKGENQWIVKSRNLLRTARRAAVTGSLVPSAWSAQKAASALERSSLTSCQR